MNWSDLSWIKASASDAQRECVQVAGMPSGNVALRNSRDPGVVMVYTPGEWDAFLKGAKAGEFDDFT